jgi:hypothetical protein
MENLYIKIVKGQPDGHPCTGSNLIEIFGNNIPDSYKPFIRTPLHPKNLYENDILPNHVYQTLSSNYTFDETNNIWTDSWYYRDMTNEEKLLLQSQVKKNWLNGPNWNSWTFNEETCEYDPPKPIPYGHIPLPFGKIWAWDESLLEWKIIDIMNNQ